MRWRGILFAAIGLVMLPPVHGDANRAVRQEVSRIYEQRRRIGQDGNVTRMREQMRTFVEQHTTPNFVIRFRGRNTTRRQYLEQIKSMGQPSPATVNIRINRLTVNGNKAVTLTTIRTVERSREAPGIRPTGRLHTTITTSTQRDTWEKTPEGWKLRMMEPLRTRMTVDGKRAKLMPANGK